MNLFVIEASVAAKWFLPARDEALTEEAFSLLRRYAEGEVRFVVPDLFWAEFGNILWKAVRRGRFGKEAAETAIAAMRDQNLPTASTRSLLEQAFIIAAAFDRTFYDAIYVALAVESKAQLITADEKLANALAAHMPVKWLGAV